MKLYRKTGSPFWWYDFSVDGKRHRESTKRQNKTEANRVMLDAYSQAQNAAQLGDKPEIAVSDAFDRTAQTVTGGTRGTYEAMARKWLGLTSVPGAWHLPKGIKLHELRDSHLEQHRRARLSEGLKPNSVNLETRFLSVVHHAHMKTFRVYRDLEFKTLPRFVKTRYLTEDEEAAVYQWLWDRRGQAQRYAEGLDILIFLLDTGTRRSELANARWSDLNLTARLFEVYRVKTASLSVVPLTDRVVDMLNRRRNLPTPFPHARTGLEAVREALEAVCNTDERLIAQRGTATVHSLRDTFGSKLVRRGMSLHELAKLLGHTTASMSAKYAHLEGQDVAAKARELLKGA
ncbi:site-specific integrase [Paracoccus sp. (in: a-proteobacteria)]|uniref:tyrosine-type recombinase/integrase n=1 Tax=Paracoccus sp. TaxID=267 RepID=UPI0026E09D8F|nr:site-specific integrase [Paracoccus sp. (in: a-proteobacteria)]MDO5647385.1 site-specific integrase [Paracoccus sp. (in: a-proteobacteria)]